MNIFDIKDQRIMNSYAKAGEWIGSRFNMWTREIKGLGGDLLIYNSLSGAFMEFKDEVADHVTFILAGSSANITPELFSILTSQGFLVPRTRNEMALAKSLHKSFISNDEHLQLILMPFENCNFRCIYCYEEFKRS